MDKMGYSHGILATFVKQGWSVLDLMSGKGDAVSGMHFVDKIVCVDIYDKYLEAAKLAFNKRKNVSYVVSDSLTYLRTLEDKSFDCVMCIDGIEHLDKEEGWKLLDEIDRVARKVAMIFTPEGQTYNKPHNAWGIPGGDVYQEHKSGWSQKDFLDKGFVLENYTEWSNAYTNEPYHSMLMVKKYE